MPPASAVCHAEKSRSSSSPRPTNGPGPVSTAGQARALDRRIACGLLTIVVGGFQAELENVLRAREVSQLAHPQVGEHDVVGQGVDDEFGGRTRAQDLATGGQRSQAGGAVDRPAEVVAVAKLGFAGVQCHPDTHGLPQRPGLVEDRVLQLDGGGGRR